MIFVLIWQIKVQEYVLGSMTKSTESSATSGTEIAEVEKVEEMDPTPEAEKEVGCSTFWLIHIKEN